ncbi:hypothetical protein BCR44DRAFT_37215 [Catenaria anguillulae PL171]|uniref:Large ribosomal subunit protein mL59 domain-containing protein n=1 Tax=Catenaria anguillulae PL171 TaxID=765915 RepID=A0A1Y2HYH1_9FUNG|nr:hypothetical protein BCR44DRAFT_37215 [Catenaria anguillulae PL171]
MAARNAAVEAATALYQQLPRLDRILTPRETTLVCNVATKVASLAANPPSHPVNLYTVERNQTTGNWRKPRYSARQQAVLRKAQLLSQSHGAGVLPLGNLPGPATEHKPLRTKLPKLPKDQRAKAEREAKIQERLAAMDKTMEEWRRQKAIDKAKLKSDLPF